MDTLFDMPEPVEAEDADVRLARRRAEDAYTLAQMVRYYEDKLARAVAAGMHEAAAYYRQRLAETERVWG